MMAQSVAAQFNAAATLCAWVAAGHLRTQKGGRGPPFFVRRQMPAAQQQAPDKEPDRRLNTCRSPSRSQARFLRPAAT